MSALTSTSWGFVRDAARTLDAVGREGARAVGVTSWDEDDESGWSVARAIREQLQRARDAARSASRAVRDAAQRALAALQSAADTAAQWCRDAAARVDLRAAAREAAAIAGAAVGAAVPSWIWVVLALALARGTRDVRDLLR